MANLTSHIVSQRGKRERYEALRDGGGRMVLRDDVILKDIEAVPGDAGLALRALRDGAYVEASCQALGLPEDWRPYGRLHATVRAGGERLLVELSVLGARNRLVSQQWIEAGTVARLAVELADLPLAAGTRPPFTPNAVRLRFQWGDTWPSEGALVEAGMRWPATAANPPVEAWWLGLELEDRNPVVSFAVVDAFGQRRNADWPSRVRDSECLHKARAAESAWLSQTTPPAERSRFGGWTGAPRLAATGFFRVEQVDGRWWYVDPDGWRFWSVGTTGVRVSDTTPLTGREELFAELPPREGPLAAFYRPPVGSPANRSAHGEVGSFYLLNVLRKYGSLEAWRDQVVRRFRVWGYNTIGNWSDALMLTQSEVAHTRGINSAVGPDTMGRFPDVFSPAWAAAFDRLCAESVAPSRGNPWLLGWFVDNELRWDGVWKRVLETAPDAPVRGEWVAFVRQRFGDDPAVLAAAFPGLRTWDDLRGLTVAPPVGPGLDALAAFNRHYAEAYFSRIRTTLKRHDPEHLYLGCRFVRRPVSADIAAAAGRHCDVVTVNCYSLVPHPDEFSLWHRLTGRPIQIGEHHLPLASERQLRPLFPAFTRSERRIGYERFVRTWAEQPYSVGAHWFQFADQNATGRPADGENQTVGFVDITDQPHSELVEAAMSATRALYRWHADAADGADAAQRRERP